MNNYHLQDKQCSCLASDPGTLPPGGPCDGKKYKVRISVNQGGFNYPPQVYNVAAHEPSPSCDHLNFAKHVFQPGSYRLAGGMVAWCGHQQEEVLSHGSYDQTGMKLARR